MTSRRVSRALAACLVAAVSLFPLAGAASVTPVFFGDTANLTCEDLQGASSWQELKVDPPQNGTFSDGQRTVQVSELIDIKNFDWSSDLPVDAVYVKAGKGGSFLYVYPGGSTGDSLLQSPKEKGNQISHISFCYSQDAAPPPPPEPRADLRLEKVADAERLAVGSMVGFSLRVENLGPDASPASLVDLLPSMSGAWSVSGPDASSCSIAAAVLSCEFAPFPAGLVREVHVAAPSGPADCGWRENAARVSSAIDPDPSNDAASARSYVICADVGIEKLALDEFVAGGLPIGFRMTVRSHGPDAATNVSLHDELPPLALDAWSLGGADAADCLLAGLILDCAFGTMEPGESRVVEASAVSCRADCKDLVNVAGVDADIDIQAANDIASASIRVTCVCPHTIGYWKNHPSAWPVSSLMLGGKSYSSAELMALLKLSPKGDASIILAHQLIAAKLGAAAGADASFVSADIAGADALLAPFASKLPHAIKSSSALGASMVAVSGRLDAFNNGRLTPGCSSDVALSVAAIPAVLPSGSPALVRLSVQSLGPSPASGVVAQAALPAGAWSLAGPDAGDCWIADASLRCVFLTLPAGASRSVELSALLPVGSWSVAGAAASDGVEGSLANNAASASILVLAPP